MPAVHLTRLRFDVARLLESSSQPAVFVRRLHDLLDSYTDRTFRPGKTSAVPPLLPHYQVPAPLMRQIESELGRICAQPSPNLSELMDALWQDGYLETRMLAIFLLKQSTSLPMSEVMDRIKAWAQPGEEPRVLNALLVSGETRWQIENQAEWVNLIKEWLEHPSPQIQALGFRALLSLVDDPQFIDLPAVYHLLDPFLLSSPSKLLPDLITLIKSLAQRSPVETAYILCQALEISKQPGTMRLVRRCLPCFEPELQTKIRSTLLTVSRLVV